MQIAILEKKFGCYVLSFSEEHNVYLQQDGFLDKNWFA
jgi:hypothetical protein